jgi:hypothetical protein
LKKERRNGLTRWKFQEIRMIIAVPIPMERQMGIRLKTPASLVAWLVDADVAKGRGADGLVDTVGLIS